MKRFIAALAAFAVLVPLFTFTASAEVFSGECGENAFWSFDEATGALTVSGEGEVYSYDDYYYLIPWDGYRSKIKSVTVEEGVTRLPTGAFMNCENLTDVSLPEGLCELPWNAFSDCTSLVSVVIPDSVTAIGDFAFNECENLISINLPEGLTDIRDYAFWKCDGLAELVFPDSLLRVGRSALSCQWYYNHSEDGAVYAGKVLYSDHYSRQKNFVIPDGIVGIAAGAFSAVTSLESVYIPASLRFIGSSAFSSCDNLSHVEVADLDAWLRVEIDASMSADENSSSPVSVSKTLYYDGQLVTDVVFPEGVVKINDGMFMGYDSLRSVAFPEGLAEIGDSAFENCTGLASVDFPDSLKIIGQTAFAGSGLTAVTVPDGVERIGNAAFSGCESLVYAVIGEGISSVAAYTFYYCTALENVTFPSSAYLVGDRAFDGCKNLASVYYRGTQAGYAWLEVKGYYNAKFNGAKKYYDSCISAAVHTYGEDEDVCSVCGKRKNTSTGFCGDGVFWSYDGASCGFTVYGAGDMFDYDIAPVMDAVYAPWINYYIKTLTVCEGVTSIGIRAFEDYGGLESLSIPASLERIGTRAFGGCFGLEDITVAEGNECFLFESGCLIELATGTLIFGQGVSTVPDGVKAIDENSIMSHGSVVTLPASLEYIGRYAFMPSSYVMRLYFRGSEEEWNAVEIDDYNLGLSETPVSFYCCLDGAVHDFENGVCNVCGDEEPELFGKCGEDVTWHYLHGVLTLSGTGGMYHYINLAPRPWESLPIKELTVEEGVTGIGAEAFRGVKTLEKVTLAESVERISLLSFASSGVKSFRIPKNVRDFDDSALSGCDALEELTVAEDNTEYACVSNCLYMREGGCTIFAFDTDVIPDGVKVLTYYAMDNISGVSKLTLPASLLEIDAFAFGGFNDLTDVYFRGTEAQWNAVDFEGGNEKLTGASVHFDSCIGAPEHTLGDDGVCTVCGYSESMPGDLSGDEKVTAEDAIYLLYHVFFPDDYPVSQPCDFDKSGAVDANDAIFLLYHVFFPGDYVLNP